MQADVMAGRPRVSSARLAQAGRGLPIFASQHLPFASDCFTAINAEKGPPGQIPTSVSESTRL